MSAEPFFTAIAMDHEQAHAVCSQAYQVAKAEIDNGANVQVSVALAVEPVTVKQRKFLHGPVLSQISEQVRIGGERYVIKVWKDYFHDLFLPDEWHLERRFHLDKATGELVPDKRATPRRVRISTEELGPKAYAQHTEKIIDYATVEWGVVFQFQREEQDLRAHFQPRRKEHGKQ